MRLALSLGLLSGVLIGALLASQVATSQEEILPVPDRDGQGRFQIAGHSTYPPLLLDSETGTAWILMSDTDGEARRWIWEPIEMGVIAENPAQSKGRNIARSMEGRQSPQRSITVASPRSLSW
jgi:hypothetical protein